MMKRAALMMAIALALAAGTGWAKLPVAPMSEEQKAKAGEAKAKAAEAAKKEAELLGRYQDKVAAHYKKTQGKSKAAAPAPAKAAK
ncbi:MAG: formate dehydrogenase [Betaproteobacteria bacterium]|nr:formate dehydrogenase [Betaproteobacteria bacterium]MBI2959427.1 formate dehydrogenase [Betaproteobacteria bacterium]